jgi:hypothetical protein
MGATRRLKKYKNTSVAIQLREYIKKRAKVEGVGFELPLSIFTEAIKLGASPIFGVHVSNGQLLKDDQEPYPGFFEKNK